MGDHKLLVGSKSSNKLKRTNMHQSKQNQTHPKSQVKSQTREGLEAQESFLDHQNPLVQQFSGLGNIPNASVHAQILSGIPANQIAANPELMLQMQQQFGNSHVSQVVQMAREMTGQSLKGESAPHGVQQENKTGLPDNLKTGIENLSGMAMDDVKVHYNSAKPSKLQALAYTQGTDIHVAPGQETHLPHEAWHVVQQKQGRVKPTIQAKGKSINDDPALEKEADVMGTQAAQGKSLQSSEGETNSASKTSTVIQGMWPFDKWPFVGNWAPFDNQPSNIGSGVEAALDVGSQVASDFANLFSDAKDKITNTAAYQYFYPDVGFADGQANNDHSDLRKLFWAWADAAVSSMQWVKDKTATLSTGLTGKDTADKVIDWLAFAIALPFSVIAGILGGALASVGYTVERGVSGAYKHTKEAMEGSEKDVEAYIDWWQANVDNHWKGWFKLVALKATSPIVEIVDPILRGLASGAYSPEEVAKIKESFENGAAYDTYKGMLENIDQPNLAQQILSLPHAGAAMVGQTAIGVAAGTLMATKNTADTVANLIGPGPIASLTISSNFHTIFQGLEGFLGETSADVTQSADTVGALAQVLSGIYHLPMGMYRWATHRVHGSDYDLPKQREALDELSGGFSNILRGGAFAAQELAKGIGNENTAVGTVGKAITENIVDLSSSTGATAWGYISPSIYFMHHLWRAAMAKGQLDRINALQSRQDQKNHDESIFGSGQYHPPTKIDEQKYKFVDYAHDKTKTKVTRNLGGATAASLAIIGTATGSAFLPVLAGVIGGFYGATKLYDWLSSQSRGERQKYAKWLAEQLASDGQPGNVKTEITNIAEALIDENIVDSVRGITNQDVKDRMQRLIAQALESW
jgi:hypothetical protein